MAERTSGGATGPSVIVNVALIVITIAGFLTLVRQELTSDRPAPPPNSEDGGIGSQTVDVRLWEDPLRPSKKDTPHDLSKLLDEIKLKRSRRGVRLLPVMVSGGPYSEDQESRIRSRFAVVSALGQSGYAPKDQEHVGSVVMPWPTTGELREWAATATTLEFKRKAPSATPAVCADASAGRRPTELSIRYEWYRRRTFYSGPRNDDSAEVLVLWLDERFFEDEPLPRLTLVLSQLIQAARPEAGDDDEPAVRLIGPQDSSTLRAMLPDEFHEKDPPTALRPEARATAAKTLRNIEVYVATATAMDEVLLREIRPGQQRRAPVAAALRAQGFKDVHFFNVDDARIADEILRELALRDVRLKGKDRDHIVLLSEWDTFYGRMLSLTYGAALALQSGQRDDRSKFVEAYMSGEKLPNNLHTFVYLRGLDGRTVCEAGSAGCEMVKPSNPKRGRPDSLQEVVEWRPEANKAEGPGQFDYLNRTGERIESLQADLRRRNQGEIKAIGIVGSDTYDVLLILQALRARFPNVLFFTTGLDARLWNPKERDWSRNLIVASSYGLTLHPALQRDVPPFRDSSQTALFAATLAAHDPGKLPRLTQVSPRRFEIGNTTAVDLSPANSDPLSLHPPTPSETYAHDGDTLRYKLLLAAGFIVLLTVLALYFLWNPLRRRTPSECGFLSGSLVFADPDVGGPDGASRFIDALFTSNDSFCTWMAERLRERSVEHRALSPQSVRATILATADGVTAEERKPRRKDADVLLALLNEILHHTTIVDRDVLDSSSLIDRPLIDRAAPWSEPVRWWRFAARLLQRARTRALLDDFLDRLTATMPRPHGLVVTVAGDARRAARRLLVVRTQLWTLLGALGFVALGVGWLLGRAIWDDTFLRSDGEPFSLSSGTSAWPNLTLRVISTVLAIAFILALIEQLRALFYRITRHYRMPLTEATNGNRPLCVQASALWREYREGGEPMQRLMRAAVPTIIYFVLARILLSLFGVSCQPLRGETVASWTGWIRYPFVLTFLLLSFLTIDAALRCRRFINALAALPTHYPQTTLEYFRSRRGDVADQYLEEWIDINLIADLTERVGHLLWFPGIVFFLMLASLNSWTDHWTMSKGLMLILMINFGISIVSVVILQRAAQAARCKAEDSLAAKLKRAEAAIAPSREANDASQAEKLLEEIRHLRRGAFVGIWQNPALGAVLVPSGGTAMIQLLLWMWY